MAVLLRRLDIWAVRQHSQEEVIGTKSAKIQMRPAHEPLNVPPGLGIMHRRPHVAIHLKIQQRNHYGRSGQVKRTSFTSITPAL